VSAFRPYIYVEHSRLMPESVTLAAASGAPWRFLEIPLAVLDRTEEQKLMWVTTRVQQHYLESRGQLLLFGNITGYRWVVSPNDSVQFDTAGRVTNRHAGPVKAGYGYVKFRRQT
jgi:hypothetical protein